jgi:NADH-quinone oxidoreductase subunit E
MRKRARRVAREESGADLRERLIPLLQDEQENRGFISPEGVRSIAASLGATESEVYGVATFFAQFRFTPRGKHNIKVCLGTACHVKGGENIMEAVCRQLGVKIGSVTADGRFDVERVACVGCCAIAPVIVVDNKDVHAKLTPVGVRDVLNKYE